MKEDRGEADTEEVKLNIYEDNNEEMVNFLQIVSKSMPEEEGWEEEKEDETRVEKDEREGRLVEECMAVSTKIVDEARNQSGDWQSKRLAIKRRCAQLGEAVLVTTRGNSNRKKELEREYSLQTSQEEVELMDQPNWKKQKIECELDEINTKLISSRRKGYEKVEVRKSLVPRDSGKGLFAKKVIKERDVICSYEGVEVSERIVNELFRNNDYVASAVRNQTTKEMVYIDGIQEDSCYGRFAQDPIDESLVNAKILWRSNKMVLVATSLIEDGEEIYVDYGLDYWRTRIGLLHPRLRQVMNQRWSPSRKVRFDTDCQIAEYNGKEAAKKISVKKESMPLKRVPPNYITQIRSEEKEEDLVGEDCYPAPPTIDEERFDFNNINESEELAEELQFLNGRKFIDEGRLYEIFQIRYDPEFERIIGFRKVLGAKPHREDGCAFLVYGREGLYELSERYLLDHPEERDEVEWPRDNYEWAVKQREDGRLANIFEQLEESGGNELEIGRHKYTLVHTKQVNYPMLVRIDENHKKGTVSQTIMVPGCLVKKTKRLHHEGYGHMGANRMLETIRLHYFWIGMEAEINQHRRDCINCKLRKSYQRRPRVPLMKYDDTARPLDRVHVDLTGPLPITKAKNKYILVIKDYLTKYVSLVPLRGKGAVEIAEAFVGEFICQAGIPGRVVISDRGNEIVNQLLKNVARILNVNRISTTPYNPRADGFVENHNKTLKDQLFHFVDKLKQDDWDVYLPTVQLMYNTTVTLATGYTPMLLMTGREARMPSFNHMEEVAENIRAEKMDENEFVLKMVEIMRAYHDFAFKQTLKNKERFNVRVKQPLEFVGPKILTSKKTDHFFQINR